VEARCAASLGKCIIMEAFNFQAPRAHVYIIIWGERMGNWGERKPEPRDCKLEK